MTARLDSETIEELWRSFKSAGPSGREAITAEGLRRVMQSLGHQPTDAELRHILFDAGGGESVTFERFVALVTALQGDEESRLRLAFEVFDANGDGVISAEELGGVLGRFGLSEAELDEIFRAADLDGDGAIDFDEFRSLMPQAHTRAAGGYRASPPPFAGALRQESAETGASHPASAANADLRPSHPQIERGHGTSRLQMQIGLFRLLQGAAYRSFRENYCANYETHLRARKLPYRLPEFVAFARRAMALYKALGVVEPACFPILDAVADSIEAEYARLQERIANWATLDKTPEMLATASAMQEERSHSEVIREIFAAGVEFALTLRKHDLGLADLVEDLLAVHEVNRLRRLELHEEMAPPPAHDGSDPRDYLKAWNRVLLVSAEEEIDGAMMPAAYWYEDFMPKLLAACSVATADDFPAHTVPDEAALDAWFARAREAGEFDRYGADVAAHFADCTPAQKLAIRQAWRLTRHYLNGVQKRRERAEFGRESGFLSQYVAFLDVALGRSDVRDAQMRLAFPYYLGPAMWRFLHTTAEIVCSRSAAEQAELIRLFKDFFKLFASMYPCPYCRYHLTTYVVRNREVEIYPIEYLLLGPDPGRGDFEVALDDRLAAVTDGPSLRLFLWKLHNSVSASIARTEPWFHQEEKPFYTTRHWPSLEAELARARALRHDSMPVAQLARLDGLLKPAARLAALRRELRKELQGSVGAGLAATCDEARVAVGELEAALAASAFLEETYAFDPALEDEAPHFTPEEEAFGRSGVFVEA